MKKNAPSGKYNLLLVDDDPIAISTLGGILQEFGQLRFATSGLEALRIARQLVPDLMLLDIEMKGMNGLEVYAAMKESPLLTNVPVIFLTSHDDAEEEATCLALGAADFISKPVRAPQVVARVRMHLRMKKMADALRHAAYVDALTGITNRRQFDETMQHEWQRAQWENAPLSLIMVDIDAFKNFNDKYGHQAGDHCLSTVAQAMRKALHRPADLLARYGGEEFVVMLSNTDASGAEVIALNFLQTVEQLGLPHAASPVAGTVTISVGVTSYDQSCRGWVEFSPDSRFGDFHRPLVADMLAAADQALYAAKTNGRRQVRRLSVDDLGLAGRAFEVRPVGAGMLASVPDRIHLVPGPHEAYGQAQNFAGG